MAPGAPKSDGWTDRQLPAKEEVFLDHVGYFVADLTGAGQRLERLGFQVSVPNVQMVVDAQGQPRPSGTSNRLARLRRGFLELLAATHATTLADQLVQALGRDEGLHLLALSHEDLAAQRARLVATGFAMQRVVSLRRPVQTPDGTREVAWSVLRPEPGVMAEGRVQFVTSHTPELSWPSGSTVHENGADGLTELLLCVEDRQTAATRYGRYVDRQPAHCGDFSVVGLNRGSLLFTEPKEAAPLLPAFRPPTLPFIAGQALRSVDLKATRAALLKHRVAPLWADEELVCVSPADALGAYLLFHAPSVRTPWATLGARRQQERKAKG
jgi:hypothetical protein